MVTLLSLSSPLLSRWRWERRRRSFEWKCWKWKRRTRCCWWMKNEIVVDESRSKLARLDETLANEIECDTSTRASKCSVNTFHTRNTTKNFPKSTLSNQRWITSRHFVNSCNSTIERRRRRWTRLYMANNSPSFVSPFPSKKNICSIGPMNTRRVFLFGNEWERRKADVVVDEQCWSPAVSNVFNRLQRLSPLTRLTGYFILSFHSMASMTFSVCLHN